MKNILIIYPHWPPSNLAGVHRPRLIANCLSEFGWRPIVLTVHEQYYEETPDPELTKTVSPQVEVIKVGAGKVVRISGMRLVGDIGLRGFIQLYRKAREILRSHPVSFVWIPVPSFYTSLIGRALFETTGTPYGIDYIDPWVSKLAPHHRRFSRAWWSKKIAGVLEPVAVKKAALISGVAESYYQGVLERNFRGRQITHAGMPYGFDPRDHEISINSVTAPWENSGSTRPIVYAGAFLPQSHLFIKLLFHSIRELKDKGEWPFDCRLFFLGTGPYKGKKIIDYAKESGVDALTTEINIRFPYLHILQFLRQAQGVMVIGSTERHYTASKIFQALLSRKPLFGILHEASPAIQVLQSARADEYVVRYRENMPEDELKNQITDRLDAFLSGNKTWSPDLGSLHPYSARASAKALVEAMEAALSR